MLEVYKKDYFQFPTVFLKPGNGYVSINQLYRVINYVKTKTNQINFKVVTIRDSNAPSQKLYSTDFIFNGSKWEFEVIHESDNIPRLLGISEDRIEKNSISVVLDLEDSNSAVACVFLDRPKIPSINTNFESMSATINTKYLQ